MSWFRVAAFGVVLSATVLPGCGDSPTGLDLVTISGTVIDIDNQRPAKGVLVKLLDTPYSAVVPTGDDGAYSLTVPRGVRLLLHADDFDPNTDDWFSLVNADHPPQFATSSREGWLIHSCPSSRVPQLGSVAAWDHYLENGDPANGDMFVPDSTAAAGGIIALGIFETNSNAFGGISGISATTDSPSFPIGYVRCGRLWNSGLTPDWNLGPDLMHPATRTATDSVGVAYSWGDPAFTGSSVTLTFADTDTLRAYAIESPFEVPVAPGMITLTFVAAVDGIPNKTASDLLPTFVTLAPELQACLGP